MYRFLFLILSILVLAGCRQSAQPAANANVDITVEAETRTVGETTLVITLTDDGGQPVSADKVEVRGDMTHPGMTPVLAETENGAAGVYRVPFEWTMSGDWLVTVTATLPDGTTAEERFDLSIDE